MINAVDLQAKFEELQKRVQELENKPCHHVYEEVGGRNRNYRTYFNGCNAYHVCTKCGHRERC
jgi:hypothetical protein